jgi:hypothetical protein
MAETLSKTQLPLPPPAIDFETFQRGVELGRAWADKATRRVAAWAEENPGQAVLAGVIGGFLAGMLLFHRRRGSVDLPDLDLD